MKPAELAASSLIAAMEIAAQAEAQAEGFGWAIVEIEGHRRHAGGIREGERFGA